eukprot:TRINITY_DN5160_c0_g1_i1.p1 TRINITY_DN5160_c0_g1~~TRINITY_DN5160_c0_g1_i1.p1  ORF type:complete len:306 (-),score=89.65 TRINITY_DN5160_c0_g1_i1:421-1338(-)
MSEIIQALEEAGEEVDRFVRRNFDHSGAGEYGQANEDGEFDMTLAGGVDNADHIAALDYDWGTSTDQANINKRDVYEEEDEEEEPKPAPVPDLPDLLCKDQEVLDLLKSDDLVSPAPSQPPQQQQFGMQGMAMQQGMMPQQGMQQPQGMMHQGNPAMMQGMMRAGMMGPQGMGQGTMMGQGMMMGYPQQQQQQMMPQQQQMGMMGQGMMGMGMMQGQMGMMRPQGAIPQQPHMQMGMMGHQQHPPARPNPHPHPPGFASAPPPKVETAEQRAQRLEAENLALKRQLQAQQQASAKSNSPFANLMQ